MDKKSAIKNNNNWVRCQSKSRPGQYYLFNTKTRETQWCTESSDKTQQNILAKCKMKTPAQDRLKRLQKNLEKLKHKESSLAKAKDSSKNKRLDEKRTVEPIKEKPTAANEDATAVKKSVIPIEVSALKKTPEKRMTKSHREKDSPVATEKQKNDIQSNNNKFRIPKKTSSQPENTSKKKAEKRKHDDVLQPTPASSSVSNKPSNDSSGLTKETTNVSSPKKIRTSDETTREKTSPDLQNKVQCDLNANIEPSKDQKSTIMSVLKGYCTSFFKQVVHTNKGNKPEEPKKQSNLSQNSKPSFKSKKTVPKGSKQENQGRKQLPMPKCSSNTTLNSSSSIGCANDRLQRLRRSLQDQQTSLNRSQHTSPISSSFVSSPSCVSVCSLSSSHVESESMDWQPICDDSHLNNTTISSVSNVSSSNVSTRSEHWDTVNENLLRLAADKKQQLNHWKTDYFYFVVDTNVFLENVTFVDELTTMKLCDTAGTIIYIPYCVLQELDKLKIRSPSESIKTRSTRAIHFINKAFETRSNHIQAQSSADEIKHLIKVTSPDDSILNCCLQVKEHIENVMLLTEDINLRNKAMCSDILVSTKSDLISKHESLL